MIFTKSKIEIILPPLIGDCIMTFPLINQLKNWYDISLICTYYTLDFISFTQSNNITKNIKDIHRTDCITIDFLSDNTSIQHLQESKPKISIGFPDCNYNYTHLLKLPKEFYENQANDIFLYALNFLNIPYPNYLDFSFSKTWHFNNQEKILIAPGAGNLDRCFDINEFILLADKLSVCFSSITFLIGPKEQILFNKIPKRFNVIFSQNIAHTIDVLDQYKILIVSEGGLMHIASAYGMPLIGLFKIASPQNWFPYNNSYQVALGSGTNNYSDVKSYQYIDADVIISNTLKIYESVTN